LRCAYSLPSSAFFERKSRVSSPAFGAKSTPTRAPMPRPTRKYVTLEPTLSAMATSKRHANTARVRLQWHLTGMGVPKRLLVVRMLRGLSEPRQNLFRAFPWNNLTQFFYACSLNIRDPAEFL